MIKCESIHLDHEYLHVKLEDGRIVSTPLSWYPSLMSANEDQKMRYKLIANRTMIEWPELDLHLDIEEMLRIDHEAAA